MHIYQHIQHYEHEESIIHFTFIITSLILSPKQKRKPLDYQYVLIQTHICARMWQLDQSWLIKTWISDPIVVPKCGNTILVSLPECGNIIPISHTTITITSISSRSYIYIRISWLPSFNYFIYNKGDQYCNIHTYTSIIMKQNRCISHNNIITTITYLGTNLKP